MAKGRPREFDPDVALEQALKVFWSKGFEGASMPELTKAMGINRPSLYATFGNKEELFRKAVRRYIEGPAGYIGKALAAPTAREVAEKLWQGGIDVSTCPENPSGCLILRGSMGCGDAAQTLKAELVSLRASGERRLRERFEEAAAAGELPEWVSAADLARYVMTVMHGISAEATGGATREELMRVKEMALKSWPGHDTVTR